LPRNIVDLFALEIYFDVMPITVAPDQRAEILKSASADIRALFDRKSVDEDFAVKLYSIGINTVELFATFAKDEEELHKLAKAHFEIDSEDILQRVKLSRITVAWQTAKTRAAKQTEQDGDCDVRRVPKDLAHSTAIAMRTTFENNFWELQEKQVPARSYLERKLDEIEKDDLRAEPLEEVVSAEEDDPDALRTEWRPDGQLRAVRIGTKVSLPKTPEQLRARLALLGTTLMFAAVQQKHKTYLKGLSPQVFVDYVDYLLGDHVLGLAAKGSGQVSFGGPSWQLVISYEHAIRKKMSELVKKKGLTIKEALKNAYEDPVTKERNFTTPLCLETVGSKRPAPPEWAAQEAYTGKFGGKNTSKGSEKGAGKGKYAKGEGKGNKRKKDPKRVAPQGCHEKTPDGKNVCYFFNRPEGCTRATCPFAHVCGKCFAPNTSMMNCSRCGTGKRG